MLDTGRLSRQSTAEHRRAFFRHIGIHVIASACVTTLFGVIWILAH